MGFSIENVFAFMSLILVNFGAISTAWVRLNIKIAEIQKDVLSIRADMDEHKLSNKDDIKEIKDSVLRDSIDNKSDHQRMIDSINDMKEALTETKLDIIKALSKR